MVLGKMNHQFMAPIHQFQINSNQPIKLKIHWNWVTQLTKFSIKITNEIGDIQLILEIFWWKEIGDLNLAIGRVQNGGHLNQPNYNQMKLELDQSNSTTEIGEIQLKLIIFG